MLTFLGSKYRYCDNISRRSFLKVGALGVGGLTLADLFRLQARGAVRPRSLKSIIMVYLHGGPSHIDTFDMKPDAPPEVRGEFKPIQTSLPGLSICEHLPLLAKIADKTALIRNLSFLEYTLGHNPPLVYSGYPAGAAFPLTSRRPTFGSAVSKLRGGAVPNMPPYVAFDGVGTHPVLGDYLGVAHRPYVPGEKAQSLGPTEGMTLDRMADRKALLGSLDTLRRDLDDARGSVAGMDAFQARALDMVLSSQARDAFDISLEPETSRAKYAGGTQFLQARRLVEAGVQVVTLTANNESKTWDLAGPWDHHGGVFTGLRRELPALDKRLYALITDLHERGLDKDVAVVVWGEMGRTPKVNGGAGRDHWCDVGFALVYGGGLRMGQVIGATTPRAERSAGRPYTPKHLLATLYANVLGIDPASQLGEMVGRPMPVLEHGETIAELV
ncbi:hypothetical protein AYO44_06065 [Planctomycetaceae bacterium SCGC AG-212-F19]|nr:hypothetical protein AYO44_06065 [Planctomycetaceae bacterium SCGC AG-212-F19]